MNRDAVINIIGCSGLVMLAVGLGLYSIGLSLTVTGAIFVIVAVVSAIRG